MNFSNLGGLKKLSVHFFLQLLQQVLVVKAKDSLRVKTKFISIYSKENLKTSCTSMHNFKDIFTKLAKI